MKAFLIPITLTLGMAFLLIFPSSCSEETSSSSLVGLWTVTSVDYDAFVDGKSMQDYFQQDMGLTQEETAQAMVMMDQEVDFYLMNTIIEFESDYYYWTNIGDPAGDDGEWSINASETVITLDAGTIWETQVTVNSMTSNTLKISFEMEEEIDVDYDPETPDVPVDFDVRATLEK